MLNEVTTLMIKGKRHFRVKTIKLFWSTQNKMLSFYFLNYTDKAQNKINRKAKQLTITIQTKKSTHFLWNDTLYNFEKKTSVEKKDFYQLLCHS